jgi:hypothetical protein
LTICPGFLERRIAVRWTMRRILILAATMLALWNGNAALALDFHGIEHLLGGASCSNGPLSGLPHPPLAR